VFHDNDLYITGRYKEIIFVNGINYYPQDIERIIEGVVKTKSQRIVAAGIFKEKLQMDEIVIFIYYKKDLPTFLPVIKKIRTTVNEEMGIDISCVIPVKKIPVTTSGKIQRFKLIENYKEGYYAHITKARRDLQEESNRDPSIREEGEEIIYNLVTIWKEFSAGMPINIHESFLNYGGSSIQLTQILAAIDKLYPGKVKMTDFYTYCTIVSLSQFIKEGGEDTMPVSKILYQTMPGHFINTNEMNTPGSKMELSFSPAIIEGITSVINTEGITHELFYLSIFLLILSRETSQKRIAMQTAIHSYNTICTEEFNIDTIADMSSLFHYMKQRMKRAEKANSRNINEVKKINLEIPPFWISTLFYNMEYVQGSEVRGLYDLILGMNVSGEKHHFSLEYNAYKLNKEPLKNMLKDFYQGVYQCAKEY
jgi:surfactin family lipopeptide synthetase A